jgi:hypothetical protein
MLRFASLTGVIRILSLAHAAETGPVFDAMNFSSKSTAKIQHSRCGFRILWQLLKKKKFASQCLSVSVRFRGCMMAKNKSIIYIIKLIIYIIEFSFGNLYACF